MKHQTRTPIFFEANSLDEAICMGSKILKKTSCSDQLLVIDTTKDRNQHKFLGQETNSLLIYYDETTPLNNILAVIPVVRAGCFVFFAYKLSIQKIDGIFYCSFFNPLLKKISDNSLIKKNDVIATEDEHKGHALLQLSILNKIVAQCLSLNQRAQKIFFIEGERGSGKSFLAGLVAKKIAGTELKIVVTAPNRLSANSFFLAYSGAIFLDFYKTKKLHENYFLLVIDEIGSVGIDRALSLAKTRANKGLCTLLVGTKNGYEGDKNYFLLNKDLCNLQKKQNTFFLNKGRRFSQQKDILSIFCQKMIQPWLFLSDNALDIKESLAMFHVKHGCYIFSSNDLRKVSFSLLSLVYRLLKQCHYKSSPNDFWRFFERSFVFAIKVRNNQIVAACQACTEILDREKQSIRAKDVFYNSRRQKGLLTQQSICSSYVGMNEGFLERRILRISRIVTEQLYRKKGFASQLVIAIKNYAANHNIDYLSTSFAMVEEHLSFWKSNGFNEVRVSLEKNKRTGKKSILMLSIASNSSKLLKEQKAMECFFSWFNCFYSATELSFSENYRKERFTWNKSQSLSKKQIWQSIDSVLNGFRFVGWAIPEVIFWIDSLGQKSQWGKLKNELIRISEKEKNDKKDEALKIALHPLKNWLEKN